MPNPSIKKVLRKVPGAFFSLFIVFVLIGLSGCVSSELKPSNDFRPPLLVPLFKNTTFEPLLEKTLTPIFKTTLYERGWRISENTDQIAKTLVGRITRFGRRPISLNQVGSAREYRINISLEVSVLDSKGAGSGFSQTVEGVTEYIARTNSGDDRLAKDRAIREAGRNMAEQVANLLQKAIDQQKTRRE